MHLYFTHWMQLTLLTQSDWSCNYHCSGTSRVQQRHQTIPFTLVQLKERKWFRRKQSAMSDYGLPTYIDSFPGVPWAISRLSVKDASIHPVSYVYGCMDVPPVLSGKTPPPQQLSYALTHCFCQNNWHRGHHSWPYIVNRGNSGVLFALPLNPLV